MAGNNVQEAAAAGVDESRQQQQQLLQSRVDKLCEDIDNEADSNLVDREDLAEICKVLRDISGRITRAPKQELLPQSKREELDKLLPAIKRAFRRRKSSSSPPPKEADKKKKLVPSCNPFKPRASPSSKQQHKEGEEEEEEEEAEDDDDDVSLKLLLRLAQNVLEPEQYYEWTTSYVDESRIYGWDKEADEVADALVAPDDGDGLLFRAAGIAGVHGSGKTALAQKVFVHDKAKDNFALRLWVCVGPPDSEDKFDLLYRMLDNLGLDTAHVEAIVDKSNVVKDSEARIRGDPARVAAMKKKAADAAGEEDSAVFNQLLKKEPEVEKSMIGVLLYILHMTLSKTSYMIVFDDIRAYDGWYINLAQLPPPDGEWGDRLAFGLPKAKGGKHRGAVLLTCRNEEHARSMVRTGHVVRPPKLEGDHAWKLFEREYQEAKQQQRNKKKKKPEDDEGNKGADMLLEELREMKKQIVDKCLGLPVAIAEAAKGFAALDPLPEEDDDAKPAAPASEPGDAAGSKSNKDMQQAAATS